MRETPHRAESFHPPSHSSEWSFYSARLADGQDPAMKSSVQPTQPGAASAWLGHTVDGRRAVWQRGLNPPPRMYCRVTSPAQY